MRDKPVREAVEAPPQPAKVSASHAPPDRAIATEPPVYDPEWPAETLQLAYDSAVKSHGMSVDVIGSLDTKLVAVSTVATALLGLSGTVLKPGGGRAAFVTWAIAALFWGLALVRSLSTFNPRDIALTIPAKLNDARWLKVESRAYRFFMLQDLASAFKHNQTIAEDKARGLVVAMRLIALEVMALALSHFLAGL